MTLRRFDVYSFHDAADRCWPQEKYHANGNYCLAEEALAEIERLTLQLTSSECELADYKLQLAETKYELEQKTKISHEKREELSDIMMMFTRQFTTDVTGQKAWENYTTSYWRSLSDEGLLRILDALGIEVSDV